MKKGDILLKKWCFGVSYNKPKDWVEVSDGQAHTVQRYPRYRSIVLRVLSAKKKGKDTWEVEAERFASLTAKPKKIKTVIKKNKNGAFVVDGQKKLYHMLSKGMVIDEKMPPVGSLVTINKKHAIVCSVGRNELTVFVNGAYHTVNVMPGTVRWRKDNIIASMPEAMLEAAE